MSHELPSFLIDDGELLQHVGRVVYRGSPLYYGRSRTNRYDDPTRAYGVLYLGRDLPTALMESVFHKHQWLADKKRSIALKEVQSRMVRAVGVMDDVLLADLTAPVALACFAAAPIARETGLKISMQAIRVAIAGFIVPFMFIFEPTLLMIGAWHEILQSFVTASIGTVCLAAGLFGYLARTALIWERLFLLGAAILLIKPGLVTDLTGAALVLSVLVSQLVIRRNEPRPAQARPVAH